MKKIISLILVLILTFALFPAAVSADYDPGASGDPCENGHSWFVKYEVAPTCTERGYATLECEVCGVQHIEFFPALGHNWELMMAGEPTCTKDGSYNYFCTNCGENYVEKVPALGHDWEIITEITAPTCTEDGLGRARCRRCGDLQYEVIIPAVGHAYELSEAVPATCTEDGYFIMNCPRCGDWIISTLRAYGHDFVNGYTITVQPTPDEPGVKSRRCARCNAVVTEEVYYIEGDADGDGTVNVKDLALMKKIVAGAAEGFFIAGNADLDFDGLVKIKDLSAMKKLLAG